ncbi:MAG: GHKL domain-containing protein [Coriobacteriia bacterium]|nr:GHKL domain-containing protein [Coriobacteriia bacterium]MCL2870512.1 GHKL domain-containing protein [Coriobacteriia bacterium]
MSVADLVVEAFNVGFGPFFLLLFFDIFLEPRFPRLLHRISQVAFLASIIAAVIVITRSGVESNFFFELLSYVVLFTAFGKILYKDRVLEVSKPSATSLTIILLAFSTMLGVIAFSAESFIHGENLAPNSGFTQNSILLHMSLFTLIYIIPFTTAYVVTKNHAKRFFVLYPQFYLYLVSVSAFLLIVILFPMYNTFAFTGDLSGVIAFLVGSILLFVLAFIVLSTLYQRLTLKRRQVQLDFVRQRNELLSQNLNDVKHLHQERSKLAHDFNHHLSVLHNLAKEEGNEKLCAYIEGIHSPIRDIVPIENTGNEFLDTILMIKKQQAARQNIAMDINCNIITPLTIEPVDLTAIVANLLENALEACEKVEDPDGRYVFVDIKSQGAFLNIRIENSANDELIKQNKKMQTTKKNKELHGIGLKSVRSSVERYQGDILFERKEGVFIVSITLCLDL